MIQFPLDGSQSQFDLNVAEFDESLHNFLPSITLKDTQDLPMQINIRSGQEHLSTFLDRPREDLEIRRIREGVDGNLMFSMELSYLPNSLTNSVESDREWVMRIHRRRDNSYFALVHTDPSGDRDWILPEPTDTEGAFDFFIPVEFEELGTHILRMVHWEVDEAQINRKGILKPRPYSFCHIDQEDGRFVVKSFPKFKLSEEEEEDRTLSLSLTQKWESLRLDQGPTLLLLHGLKGNTKRSFENLIEDKKIMRFLGQKYGNRIIGFDHPSILRDPIQNADFFAKIVNRSDFPYKKVQLELDILARSRGAMVARQIVEGLPEGAMPFHVDRVLLLGGPLQGTPSARQEHMIRGAEINGLLKSAKKVYKDRLQRDIGSESKEIIEIDEEAIMDADEGRRMLAYNRMIAERAELCKGVKAMEPLDAEVNSLNSRVSIPEDTQYYTIGVKYDPNLYPIAGKRRRLIRRLKKVFGDIPNDGVNPYEGALGKQILGSNLIGSFEIISNPDVHHESLLLSPEIKEKVVQFLTHGTNGGSPGQTKS